MYNKCKDVMFSMHITDFKGLNPDVHELYDQALGALNMWDYAVKVRWTRDELWEFLVTLNAFYEMLSRRWNSRRQ